MQDSSHPLAKGELRQLPAPPNLYSAPLRPADWRTNVQRNAQVVLIIICALQGNIKHF